MAMRLLEAIIDANHRALAGDPKAGLRPADFEDSLPIVALTCIDTRLNTILPQVLGVPPEEFIWLRNAGNVITGPLTSTMRSLALACAIKGGKEIAIIGHTDCLVGKTSTTDLLNRLQEMGVERHILPENVGDYFGIFGTERQLVMKSVEIARRSPLIGSKTPIHGLMVDVETGRVEWLVNGYQALGAGSSLMQSLQTPLGSAIDSLKPLADFNIGEMKFPDAKIGEIVSNVEQWVKEKIGEPEPKTAPPPPLPPSPPKIPMPPPPLRPRIFLRKGPK